MTKVVLFFQAATLKSKSWRDKITGIHKYGLKAKWHVQMVQSDASADEVKHVLDIWKPIGCIIDRGLSNSRNPLGLFRGIPVVLIDQNPDTSTRDYSNVIQDSTATTALAVQELLRTGVSHFSYVPHRLDTHWNRERQKAMSSAIQAAGKRFLDWGATPFSRAFTSAQQDQLIAKRLREFPAPCGLLCANDQIAERVMHVATTIGLSIPKDLAVIGVDNDDFICENTHPPLSSVLPDFQGAGYLAAQLLDNAVKHPNTPPVTVRYGPLELVRRQSTQRFTFKGRLVNHAMEIIAAKALDPGFHTTNLCDELKCSRSTLEMRFRQETGHSIRTEISRIRFEKALLLLANPYQSITAIPALCGYTSNAFFKRHFKQKTGLTMREWRRQNAPSRF